MLKDSKFQLIVIGLCIVLAVGGLFLFAVLKQNSNSNRISITVWGTLKSRDVMNFLTAVKTVDQDIDVSYVEKAESSFAAEYTDALATGKAPDAVLAPQEILFYLKDKISTISSDSYPVSMYRSTFIPESELFINSAGITALPFAVDPMVMYWNRDIFTNANIPLPPAYWEETVGLAQTLTERSSSLTILQSALALGRYSNITHAKDIISLLILQAGNPIVTAANGIMNPVLTERFGYPTPPADSALMFYTQFADPLKKVYSWNGSLPDSKQYFIGNKLALYFGYASEFPELRAKNPNLNFDVALMPQIKSQASAPKTTFGRLYGLAVSRGAASPSDALKAITVLTTQPMQRLWTQSSRLPSVRRDTLYVDSTAPGSAVFATSALWARGWLDPNYAKTDAIFREVIDNITSNRMQIGDAIDNADNQLRLLTSY